MTIRTKLLFQKFLNPLHALFILDLCEGIFHSVDSIEIGKIQFSCLIGIFVVVKNMLFLGGTVKYDFFFLLGKIPERHIRAHSHLPANVCHQRPHQTVPGGNGALVDGQGVVRYE